MQQARATAQPSAAVARRAAPALALLILVGCGGGSGGGDAGGDALAAADLTGTWGGTLNSPLLCGGSSDCLAEPGTLEIDIGPDGDIVKIVVNAMSQDVNGVLEGPVDGAPRLFEYDLVVSGSPRGSALLYAGAGGEHAGLVIEDGAVGVVEKGTTAGTYSADAAVGDWRGASTFVGTGLAAGATRTAAASLATASGGGVDGSLALGDCTGIDVALDGFDSRYGVFEDGTIAGGSGADCPAYKSSGSDSGDAQAYMTYDGRFIFLYANCRAGLFPAECYLTTLSPEG